MNVEQMTMLSNLIKSDIPILLEEIPDNIFKNIVILNSNCGIEDLNGHYEEIEFVAPKWYQELITKSKNSEVVLVIKDINAIPTKEQTKFVEILKYRKISTFELPLNCIVVATYKDINNNPINEEIYSLMAKV